MDGEEAKKENAAGEAAAKKSLRTRYVKPQLQRLGRVADFTGGLSLPALESGDPQNRHF